MTSALRSGSWLDVLKTRDLSLIFTARMAMSVSRAIAGVAVPLYLATLGFNGVELGVLYLVVALVAAGMSSGIGFATNKVGAKTFMIIVPAMVALAGVVYAFSANTAILFIFAALASFGRGAGAGAGMVGPYQPAESQLIVNSVTPANRNRAFSAVSLASTVGALIGTGLAALSGHELVARAVAVAVFRPSMLIASAAALTASVIAMFLSNQPPKPTHPVAHKQDRVFSFPQRSRWLLYRLWVTNTLNGAAVGMFGPFITYWLYIRYHANEVTIGELYLVVNIITLGSGLVAPRVAQRFGSVRITSWLRIAQGLLLIPFAISPTFVIAGIIYTVRMFAQRVALPLRQSYVLAMADPSEQARVAALSNLPSQVVMAVSPTLTGYLLDNVSLSLPFEIASVIQTISAFAYYFFFKDAAPPEELIPYATTVQEQAPDGTADETPTVQ
ncbi:MFS transporter [Ferrimicrobium sp.]|uniref:MFS transporter n=1 Tax=Ferrimicrobium sp. TaxID=2926050 RepID=UPI0026259879|nr:MFS transporter [Ferrimicrobium sp.]